MKANYTPKKIFAVTEGHVREITQDQALEFSQNEQYGTDFIIARAKTEEEALKIAEKYESMSVHIRNTPFFQGGYLAFNGNGKGSVPGYYFF